MDAEQGNIWVKPHMPEVDYTLAKERLASFSGLTRDRAMDAIHRLHERVRSMINRSAAGVSWCDTMSEDVFAITFEVSEKLFAVHDIWIHLSPLAATPGAFVVRRDGQRLHLASATRSDAYSAFRPLSRSEIEVLAEALWGTGQQTSSFSTRQTFRVVDLRANGMMIDLAGGWTGVANSRLSGRQLTSDRAIAQRLRTLGNGFVRWSSDKRFAHSRLMTLGTINASMATKITMRCIDLQLTQASLVNSVQFGEWAVRSCKFEFGPAERKLEQQNSLSWNGERAFRVECAWPFDAAAYRTGGSDGLRMPQTQLASPIMA